MSKFIYFVKKNSTDSGSQVLLSFNSIKDVLENANIKNPQWKLKFGFDPLTKSYSETNIIYDKDKMISIYEITPKPEIRSAPNDVIYNELKTI